jgi:hypothetical protein
VELFTYLDNDGQVRAFPDHKGSLLKLAQIKASPSSKGATSWVFQPVEG